MNGVDVYQQAFDDLKRFDHGVGGPAIDMEFTITVEVGVCDVSALDANLIAFTDSHPVIVK
jgi:hypothetical protein